MTFVLQWAMAFLFFASLALGWFAAGIAKDVFMEAQRKCFYDANDRER